MSKIAIELRVTKAIALAMARSGAARIASLTGQIFGDIRWLAPAWMEWLGRKLAAGGRWVAAYAGWLAVGIALAAAAWWGIAGRLM